MKTLAIYLPQFHEVKENNEWWGEGFTEWTTVKNAKPLFVGHNQPVIPDNQNYYNLLSYNTMKWQESLLKKYGIDGLCIYHYWFANGRRILEKPENNLLQWTDIDIPFCFSWANETWARTWSNLTEKNDWTNVYEPDDIDDSNGILLEQKYGNKEEWKKHFEYLIPFFRDRRYIKIDNKPVFVFHKTEDIYCFENMVDYWKELAFLAGFEGIYIIGNNSRPSQVSFLDKVFVCEPGDALKKCQATVKNGVVCYSYDEVWDVILSTEKENAIIGGFVGYDDTPRRGTDGIVIEGVTPDKFAYYLKKLKDKNIEAKNEIFIINAWNEWGEGMYLEPDSRFKDAYLKAINADEANLCFGQKEKIDSIKGKVLSDLNTLKKEKHLRVLLDKWMTIYESVNDDENLFKSFSGKRIAIYGYGILGKHLLNNLKRLNMNPVCLIDKNPKMNVGIKQYLSTDEWPQIDVIIVTATYDYGYIYKNIRTKNKDVEIVSLAHIISEF